MRIRDGDWSLFDYDFQTGRQVWVIDNPDGSQTFRTDYPVESVMKENKDFRNALDPGWKGDWHKIASIPLNIFHEQIAEASRQDDEKYLSRWLNDGDNAAWRTKEGRV